MGMEELNEAREFVFVSAFDKWTFGRKWNRSQLPKFSESESRYRVYLARLPSATASVDTKRRNSRESTEV